MTKSERIAHLEKRLIEAHFAKDKNMIEMIGLCLNNLKRENRQ